jgi:hypothetical protein
MTQLVSPRPAIVEDDFDPRAGHVGFKVERVTLGPIPSRQQHSANFLYSSFHH